MLLTLVNRAEYGDAGAGDFAQVLNDVAGGRRVEAQCGLILSACSCCALYLRPKRPAIVAAELNYRMCGFSGSRSAVLERGAANDRSPIKRRLHSNPHPGASPSTCSASVRPRTPGNPFGNCNSDSVAPGSSAMMAGKAVAEGAAGATTLTSKTVTAPTTTTGGSRAAPMRPYARATRAGPRGTTQ